MNSYISTAPTKIYEKRTASTRKKLSLSVSLSSVLRTVTLLANAYTSGRLGNRLIVSRELLAIAFEFDLPFANLAFAEYASSFQGSQSRSIFWHLPLRCDFNATEFRLLEALLQSVIMSSTSETPSDAEISHHQELAKQLGIDSMLRGSSAVILKLIEACSAALVSGAVTAPSLEALKNDDAHKLLSYVQAQSFPDRLIAVDSWIVRVPTLVAKHRDKLKAFFTPSAAHQALVNQRIATARQGADILVGVHIRQTDYRTFSGGEFFVEKSHFAGLMQQVAGRLSPKKTRFLILSDEAIDANDFPNLNIVTESGAAIEDMYCLAACDYLLRSNSTFSRWAAEFGGVPYQVVQPDTTNVDDLGI